MILTSDERSRAFIAAGLWGTATLDGLFEAAATAAPAAPAFTDAGPEPVPGAGARYDRAGALARIDALAGFFAGIGLKPDTVVGVHLPPMAEAAIVVLAAWRAGLVVAPLDLGWSDAEISAAIDTAGIRAIVTASMVDGRDCGSRMRDVAAEHFAIRFVFGFGDDLADGLIDLGLVLADITGESAMPEVVRRGNPADHIAALSFVQRDGRLLVVPSSHNHLIAAARAHVGAAGIEAGAAIATTLAPAGLAGLAGGLATAITVAGRLDFHHVARLGRLAADCAASRPDHLLLPEVLAAPLAAAAGTDLPALSLVSGGVQPARGTVPAGVRVADLATLGGLLLLSAPRDGERAAPWPLQPSPTSRQAGPSAPATAEILLRPRMRAGDRRQTAVTGDILLRGALVPDAPWPEPAAGGSGLVLPVNGDGLLRTGLTGEATADGTGVRIAEPGPEAIVVAGQRFEASALDARFATFPGMLDAAAFGVADPLLGSRIGLAFVRRPGGDCSPERIAQFLAETGAAALEAPSLLVEVETIARGGDGRVLSRDLFRGSIAA